MGCVGSSASAVAQASASAVLRNGHGSVRSAACHPRVRRPTTPKNSLGIPPRSINRATGEVEPGQWRRRSVRWAAGVACVAFQGSDGTLISTSLHTAALLARSVRFQLTGLERRLSVPHSAFPHPSRRRCWSTRQPGHATRGPGWFLPQRAPNLARGRARRAP